MTRPKKHSAARGRSRLKHYAFSCVFALFAVLVGASASADDPKDVESPRSFTMWLEVRNLHASQIEIKPLCIFILGEDDGTQLRERVHVSVRLLADDSSDTDPYSIRAHATKSYHVKAPDLSGHAALLEQGNGEIYFVVQRADRQEFDLSGGTPFLKDLLRRTVLVRVW